MNSLVIGIFYFLKKIFIVKKSKLFMVRIEECFECGAKENEVKLIFTEDPMLCENCYKKKKNLH